jgi:hypothetical protein
MSYGPIKFHELPKKISIRTIDNRQIGTINYGTTRAPNGWKYFLDNGMHGGSHSTWREAADALLSRLKTTETR